MRENLIFAAGLNCTLSHHSIFPAAVLSHSRGLASEMLQRWSI